MLIKAKKATISTKKYKVNYNKKKDVLTFTLKKGKLKNLTLKTSWWQAYDIEGGVTTPVYKLY